MGWKIARNSEYKERKNRFFGKCPRYNKPAEVEIIVNGHDGANTDLQKTYHKVSARCSLAEYTIGCLDNCPLITEKYY